MYKGEFSDGLKQGDSKLQIVPFRTGREVSISNYYYLDKMCHFGMVNFGSLGIHHRGTEDTESAEILIGHR